MNLLPVSFVHPWLLLLLIVPIALFWTIPGRRPGVTLPFDHQAHRSHWGGRLLVWTLGAFELVPLLLLATAIVILAGPQTLQQPRQERLLTNIEICLDVSGSMFGDKYRIAKEAVEEFTVARDGDAFGLTLFGSYQIRWVPLTKDLATIRNALPFADPQRQARHMMGTSIGAALKFCMANMEVEATEGDRLVILVSDGESFDLTGDEPDMLGADLRDARIVVYHIHVGEAAMPPEVTDIARATGGEALGATDMEAMRQIFRHIDLMQPARFRVAGALPMDRFAPLAFVMLGLVGTHLLGLFGARYTPW